MDLPPGQTSLLSISSESINFSIKSETVLSPTNELPSISSNYSYDTSSISSYEPSQSDLNPSYSNDISENKSKPLYKND